MTLADIQIQITGPPEAFTPEFEAVFERFEERVDNLVESFVSEFGTDVKIKVL